MTSSGDTTTTDARLLVLHVLRLGGFLSAEKVAARSGLDESDVAGVLARAQDDGEVTERTGRVAGWVLTKPGRAAHAALLADELTARGARDAAEQASAAFLALNESFKELCSRWQMHPDGSLNDHSDPEHDRAVVEDLEPLHTQVVALTEDLAGPLPRFGRYAPAFRAARERLRDGDPRALAAPLSESYHDAWMELHQDLLSTLGRERSAADGH